jgi:hypothetical protein
MKNVDPFFSITNFQTWFLARRADEALPDTVIKNLSEGEKNDKAKRLLEIIQEFEKSPTDIEAKEKKYIELMKLFYKGIGLKEDGTGTISEENQRGAIELSGLINDALLQDQQNISGKYSSDQLQKALKLQDRFRKDLENTDFKKILTADKVKDTEIIAARNDYQTEKITSYLALAENKEDFTEIFQELSKAKPDLKNLTTEQKEKLENLETLAGEKGQNSLNVILRTFKDFKEYSFTNADLTKMKKTAGAELLTQAKTESTHSQWKKLETTLASNEEDKDDKETSTSRRESRTDRILERILASLERLEERDEPYERDTRYRRERPSTPNWLSAINDGINLAGNFLNVTGLGNNNQNYCCYTPEPCYGGGRYPGPICKPYYVGGDTWPWGKTDGINSYNAFNNYMPSSGSYSSAYSNPNVQVEVNPTIFNNNNPIQTSNSTSYSGSRSSNMAEIRRSFGINS